ncbi:hypothetical protein ALI144C_40515 [Actinosynnema sp. ALI-1.44]|nr:hypothetical protein ALI144C_40515 [Actinosynnema sp. ALI-1.44]
MDATDGVLPRFAADLRRLRENAGGPTYRELSRTAHYSPTMLSEAASGRKLPSLAVTLAYVRACGGDTAEWRARWHDTAAELAGPDNGGADNSLSPYVGLSAFQPNDADRFFGRTRLVDELLDGVRGRRFLGVFGPSGSGKSSVLRAGLVARVRAGNKPALLVTPGAHPLEECAAHLAALTGESVVSLHTEFTADPENLHLRIRQATGESEMLLVVDQFEEVFTLCRDDGERSRFIQALVTAATRETSRTRVVIGVRADFYGHCAQYPELVTALRDAQIMVGPMTADELRCAIVGPAAKMGYTAETALVARLIADAAREPAALPLVSHALLETWRRRRGTRLTLDGYEETGGIHDAIARSAESVYAGLNAAQQLVAKHLFLRLTALGEGTDDTKRRITRSELDADLDTEIVLENLTRARLVTVDDGSAEIAHEALIRSWSRLRDWLTDDREGLRVHRRLTEATEAWEAHEHDPGSLYRGTRLSLTQDWASDNRDALTEREGRFLAASLAADRGRARRRRQITAALFVLLLVAIAATVVAVDAGNTVSEQRNVAIARKAADDAAATHATDPALSVQVRLAAYQLARTAETRDALLSAFAAPYASRVVGHVGTTVVAFHPGKAMLATGSIDGTARLWDTADANRPQELATLRLPEGVTQMAFGPAGRVLATAGDSTVRLWEVTDPHQPRELGILPADSKAGGGVALSPDGRTAATVNDTSVRLWDVSDPRNPLKLSTITGHTSRVSSVAFRPDGRALATTDTTVRLWDISDPRQARPLRFLSGHRAAVSGVAFSPDGRTLASAGWDHAVRLWDISTPDVSRELATLTGHTAIVWSVAFSPDGRTLASTSGETRLWDVSDPTRSRSLIALTGGLYSTAFSSDSNVLAVADDAGVTRVYDLRGLPLVGHNDNVSAVAFSPDASTLATGSWDGSVRLWDVSDPHTRRPLAKLTEHKGFVRSVTFGRDGRVLATSSDDGTVSLWDMSDRTNPRKVGSLTHDGGAIRSVAFSPDGRTLATGGRDTARLWDVSDPAKPQALAALPFPGVAWLTIFSPDGRVLAGGDDGDMLSKLWDVTDPRRPHEVPFPFSGTDFVGAFAPDNRMLAAIGKGGVRLVDMTDRDRPRQLTTLTGNGGAVIAVAFSPDSNRIAITSQGADVRLWDITKPAVPKEVGRFIGHTGFGATVAVSPDGHTLATGGSDFAVRLWETDIDRVVARICAVAYPRITQPQWEQYFPDLPYKPPCSP